MSSSKWQTSTLAHISGKDRRYSPISNRTVNRRLRKFGVGNNNESIFGSDDDRQRMQSAGILRSPTAASRSQTAASAAKNGFVEEATYSEIETARPIRINCPSDMDIPIRTQLKPRDFTLIQRLFSPAAHRDRKRNVHTISGPDLLAQLTDTTDSFGFKSAMSDAQMLATASRRAGDGHGEGLSFFRLALLQDNLQAYGNAIKAYKKFLAISERLENTPGQALALNCIGVNLQMMAAVENNAERKKRLLANALLYHDRHFDIGDTRSQFVAKINSGLILSEQGQYEAAVSNFQDALKYALILKAPREQAVAFGNLATASLAMGAFEQAGQFGQQQLSMLEDIPGSDEESAIAHLLLGKVASSNGDYKEAERESQRAMELAQAANARGLYKVAKCFVGASLARSMFDEVIQSTANQIKQSLANGRRHS